MVPSWFRNPAAILGAGVLAVALSVLVLMATDQDTGRSDLQLQTQQPGDGRLAATSLISPGRGALFGEAVVVSGKGESKYADRAVILTGPLYGRHTLLWIGDDEQRTQTLVRLTEVSPGSLHDQNSVVFYAVQRRNASGEREIGVVYDAAAFGSGSPVARFALLRLEEGTWHQVWDSGTEEEWRGSHGTVEFPSGDLTELVVRSDSWTDGHDELSDVVHESNPGPHRYFVDTWVREGDSYERSSAETVAAPYATFVEFLYALGTGDDAGAQERVTEVGLVVRARSFGLDRVLDEHWLSTCRSGLECGKSEPITFYQNEPPVAVYFEERDGLWLISDIQPDNDS